MARKPRIYLPFENWPAEDQARWQAALKVGDRFEEAGHGSHLAESTRQNLFLSYARFLGFCLSALQKPPATEPGGPDRPARRHSVCRLASKVLRRQHGCRRPTRASRCAEVDLPRR